MSDYLDALRVPFICWNWLDEAATEKFWKKAYEDPEELARWIDLEASKDERGTEIMEELFQGAMFFGFMQRLFGPAGLDVAYEDFTIRDDTDDEEHNEEENEEEYDEDTDDDTEDVADDGDTVDDEVTDKESNDHENDDETADQSDESEEGNLVITMGHLTTYAMYSMALETHRNDFEERKEHLWPQHQERFTIASRVINSLIRRRRARRVRDAFVDGAELPLLDVIILSCIILLEQLHEIARLLFDGKSWFPRWELDHALWYYLRQGGWCSGEITTLHFKFVHASSLLSLSALERGMLERDHSNCDDHACRADYIDEKTYRTKHTFKSCPCAHIGDNRRGESQIMQSLGHNIIPVITVILHEESPEGIRISVSASNAGPYVAISHVWSDGLGNPTSNTLPACQLRRIQSSVDALYDERKRPVPFWIDTICVPREKEARKKAIRMMGQTYEGADKVLVLDSWLHHVGLDDQDGIDSGLSCLKIKACTWASRLWTGQEGMLARSDQLYYQTTNGPVSEIIITEFSNPTTTISGLGLVDAYVGIAGDPLKERLPSVRNVLIGTVLRIKEIQELGELEQRKFSRGEDIVMPETNFPWKQGRELLRNLNHFKLGGNVRDEGTSFIRTTRWMLKGSDNKPFLKVWGTVGNDIVAIGWAMRNRSTSRVEDEPICIATLLGQDTGPLLEESSREERMKILASKLGKVAYSLMFAQVERIDEDGYRWAPKSYFQNRTSGLPLYGGFNIGEVRREGLLCDRLDAILLQPTQLPFQRDVLVKVGSEQYQTRVLTKIFYPPKASSAQLAILWSTTEESLALQENDAVIVEVKRREGNTFFSGFVCLSSFKSGSGDPEAKAIPGIFLRAQEYKWCVG